MKKILIIGLCVSLAGCAKSSQDIAPQFVSSLGYQNNTCTQLKHGLDDINSRAGQLKGIVDRQAQNDQTKAALGVVISPLIFLTMDRNSPQAAEYGRMKGEFETIKNVARRKNCSFMNGQ